MDKRTKFNAGKKDRVKLKRRELVEKEALAESSQVDHIASNNEFIKDKRSKREGKIDKKDLVKSKKRKLAEKEVMVVPSQVDHINSEDEFVKGEKLIEVKTEKKKKNKSGKKRKMEKDSSDEVCKVYQPPSECEDGPELSKRVQVAESKESDIQTRTESSARPQKLNDKENRNMKSKNAKKMKGQLLSVTDSRSNVSSENVASEIYHISSGNEDSSKGMKKWIKDYHQSRPGLEILQEKIDQFMTAHEEQEEQARKERESRAAEGGWTVVTRLKGRKKTTDAESGITVGSIAPAAVVDKMNKKKSKDVGIDFYRFQRREAHRNEIMMLQSKYEQDKKRIQELRAARKFRPY